MDTMRAVAVLATAAMVATIAIGASAAAAGDAGALVANAWGAVTLIDLYLAFAAVWAWIAWREGSPGRAALWAVLVAALGSVAIWGYVARAAHRAQDPTGLLLGRRRAQRDGQSDG